MLKRLLFSLLLFCTVSGVFASHFRYGLVTATRISETSTQVTYRLNVSLAWRLAAAPASVPFAISGGNSGSVTVNLTNVTDPSGGWTNSSGTANVTLNKSATPTRIEFNSSAKISTIINNHDKAWDVYTILNTNAPGSTPVTTLPAIINMPVNAIAATFTIPASDPDPGSTMTFGLPNLLSGPLAGQTEPTGFSVNATTGQITLNTTDKTVGQQYNALVTVTDNNGNQIMLDFIINMVGFSNPPAFDYSVTPANGFVYNVIAGQNISFPISATDPDAGSTVSLSVSGLPAYISTSNFSPAFPATGNPSQTTFSWTPAAAQIGTTNIINIIATDNVGVQTTTSVTMKVVAEPAPAFISPTPGESTLRQIIPGVLQQDTIVAQSSLGSNVTIAFATVPTGAVLSPAVPTSGANPGQTIMSWTPTPADFGQHSFSYQAVISSLPTIFVTRNYFMVVNTPPAFSSTPTGLNVNVGQPFSYNVTVADQDIPYGDVIDIVGTTIPSWLTLTSTGNGTAVLSGTPTAADGGINHVDLEAEDTYHHGNPSAVEQAFDINVIACTTPAFANTNGYLQQSTNAGSCDATVTYPLSVSGTPAPSITYVFTGATTGTGSGTGSGQVFNTGITHVVVTASNACTTITNNFDVTVVDNVKPIPVTKNITVYLDATGHATITPADIDNGSHDNCGAVSLSLQNTGTICATAAENSNLTLTAPAGTLITNINFASYGTPTGSCGAFVLGGCNSSVSLSKVQAAALNKNSATISATNTVFGDPCGGTVKRLYVQATYSGGTTPTNSFDCSKLGDNTVTLIVTDANGNTSSTTAIVTVKDNIAPTPTVANLPTITAQCAVTVTRPTATDICAGTITATTSDPLTYNTQGTYTINWSYNDGHGNVSTQTQTVIVKDVTAPVLNGVPANVTVECNAVPARANVTASDNCSTSLPTFTETRTDGACANNYTLTRTWTTTDAGSNTTTATQVITVRDTQAPVLSAAPANTTVSCDAIPAAAILTAADNCDASPVVSFAEVSTQDADVNSVGHYNYTITRSWTATDACGNAAVKTQVVAVRDVTAPVITIPANTVLNCQDDNSTAATGVATGTDACSPVNIVYTDANTQSSDVLNAAHYNYTITRTWTATDVTGNASTGIQVITVHDISAPVITVPANTVLNCQDDNSTVANGVATGSDNCGPVTITYSDVNSQVASITDPGHYNYTITRTWTATDVTGNATSAIQTITVRDIKAPIVTTPDNINVNNDNGLCSAVVSYAAAATDNCGPVTITYSKDPGTVFTVGTTTVTITAKDVTGNTTVSSFTVTVNDTEKPTIVSAANQTQTNDTRKCGATVIVVGPTTGDNCAVESVTNSFTGTANASGYYPVGTTTITWTVTDIHGNTNTSTQQITVTDDEKPNAITKPVTVTLVNGEASITADMVNNVSTDNCGIKSIAVSPSVFHCANIGSNTVTLTVTDIHGNVATKTAVVTVMGEIPGCTITSVPTNNTFTGGNPNNLYLGYGAQSTTLQVTPTGVSGNGGPNYTYTYSWSGASVSMLSSTTSGAPVFTPTKFGYYTFTVVTTNNYGCSTTCTISICVTDIRVPGTNGSKVYVCHLPPGNTSNSQTLSISVNAVPAHLGNHTGDRLGSCDQSPCGTISQNVTSVITTAVAKETKEETVTTEEELKVTVMPNPSATFFTLKLESKYATPVTMRVMDANGRVIDAKSGIGSNSSIHIGQSYLNGTYYAEMIQGTRRKVVQLIKLK